LALSLSLVSSLQAHKDKQTFERGKAGTSCQETGLVFTTSNGTALEARNLARDFKRHLSTAKLP